MRVHGLRVPHDDRQVYASLRKADTIGLFQVESRAQMASLPRNNPDKFYDLVVQVAIIRPGPIVGTMMNTYMERRQGRQEITYPHPLLEPVLRRTLGVPLFQEQLLRIAMTIADFTGCEAEELRRALGSRRSADKMRALEIKLADYAGTGVTVGRHPMAHCREQLRSMNVCRADDLRLLRHGVKARIAGCVIARQRPGTAHGFIFLSIEDESGISNAIIDPELYERCRPSTTTSSYGASGR